MISNIDIFNPPKSPTAKIWRYMDFAKYVWFLETKLLYFVRVDRLDDQFEGTYGRANRRMRPEVYKGLYEDGPNEFNRQVRHRDEIFRWLRQWTFINCWHQNDYESAAMWRLYAETNQAIAILSTYEKLRAQLPKEVSIGMIEYKDYDAEWLPEGHTLWPFVHKRKSFEHERELRAIIQFFPNGRIELTSQEPHGEKYHHVALTDLVEEVRVAPAAPSWFRETVAFVTRHYGFNLYVRQSSLDDEALY